MINFPFKIKNAKEKREILRNYLENNESFLVPGVYNAAIALIAENLKFKVLHIGGASISLSFGLPDFGLLSAEKLAYEYEKISSITNLPTIVDGESGFYDISKTIKVIEKSGASAIHIEDQEYFKKCGHLPNKKLIDTEKMVKKIKLALKSRKDKNFIIIARTDARNIYGFEETLKRAKEYEKAGAEVIFPEALFSFEEFKIFSEEIEVPLLANMTEFGLTPYIQFKKFKKLGYKFVIFPVSAMRISLKSVEKLFRELKNRGTQKRLIKEMKSREEIQKIVKHKIWEKYLQYLFVRKYGKND